MGGGIAGVTAAETVRERDPFGSIALFSKEKHVLYSRVALPHYVRGEIPRNKLFLRTLGDFEDKRISIFLGEEIIAIDGKKKTVTASGAGTVSFDRLLIASGGEVRQWEIPGSEKDGIYRLHSIEDADLLKERVRGVKKAIVVGGSFIALELLEIFASYRIPSFLFCRGKTLFHGALDTAGNEILASNFRKHGADSFFGTEVRVVLGGPSVSGVRTDKGEYGADAVGVGIGIARNLEFFSSQGLSTGMRGIKTNEYLETNIADIFAAGDSAEFYDDISGTRRALGRWTNAFLQGKAVGASMTGARTLFRAVPAYSITNFGFQITLLGDMREGDGVETVTRKDEHMHTYERFFIRDGILRGAFLINMFSDKPILARWIERGVSVESIKQNLFDMNFDLSGVVVEKRDG